MIPGYSGGSSYLLFSKYNNYSSGIHRIALLDPNATQVDPDTGLVEMREVLTATGCTPDRLAGSSPYAVHEWCINAGAVNPATHSVFMPNEDGGLYRWDLSGNSLSEALALATEVSEGYVPTLLGPDGTVYTLVNDSLFACGALSNGTISVSSSQPDLRHTVAGQAVTFTATVNGLDPSAAAPTGSVSFTDSTYRGSIPTNLVLAANVPLSNGLASVTTTALPANSSNYFGSHFITAAYSGDATYPTGAMTLVQKVHASATFTTVASALLRSNSSGVVFTATVAPQPATTNLPTGLVSFWDGAVFLTQRPLVRGAATFTNANFYPGLHSVTASYVSDTLFADSTGALTGAPTAIAISLDPYTSAILLDFTNFSGAPFSVLSAPDPFLPLSTWTQLGPATEVLPGQYQFYDPQPPTDPARYYRVRSGQ